MPAVMPMPSSKSPSSQVISLSLGPTSLSTDQNVNAQSSSISNQVIVTALSVVLASVLCCLMVALVWVFYNRQLEAEQLRTELGIEQWKQSNRGNIQMINPMPRQSSIRRTFTAVEKEPKAMSVDGDIAVEDLYK